MDKPGARAALLCTRLSYRETAFQMTIALTALASILILVGLICAILPAIPGIPIMFIGIWLLAAVDDYRHLGFGWLVGIACVGVFGISAWI